MNVGGIMASAARQGVPTEIETLWRFGMKKSFLAAALVAGMVGPVSAATVIDFTKDNAITGFVGGIQWDVYAENGSLANARHKTGNGCAPYACTQTVQDGDDFDVGFGVKGGANGEEIDFGLEKAEAVVVKFAEAVRLFGFAGLLAYVGTGAVSGEDVQLEFSQDGTTWDVAGVAIGVAPAGNNQFNSVGLASRHFAKAITAQYFRFKSTGISDNLDVNVTAGALHVAPVPVPASFPLLLAGIGALGWAARRKRKAA